MFLMIHQRCQYKYLVINENLCYLSVFHFYKYFICQCFYKYFVSCFRRLKNGIIKSFILLDINYKQNYMKDFLILKDIFKNV